MPGTKCLGQRHPKEPSRRVRCDSCRCARRLDDWSDQISNTKTENIYLVCGFSCARSDRTLRDGSLEGRFPRHFVPGYDHAVPPGQNTFDRPALNTYETLGNDDPEAKRSERAPEPSHDARPAGNDLSPFQGEPLLGWFPGLKPWAEFSSPFGAIDCPKRPLT